MPPSSRPFQNSAIVDKPFDEVWDALVRMAAQTFFAIDNFEKSSGLMTLSFGAQDAERFIDCGQIVVSGLNPYEGPWAAQMQDVADARLQGRMNLLVQRDGPLTTRVTANTRYVFYIPPSQNARAATFAFNAGESATLRLSNPVLGSSPERTCRSTGLAEREVLTAVGAR
jgi:hypothetical protein